MCGISGIISKKQHEYKNKIISMTDIIKHRGPDGSGYYYENDFAFGHRRLAIIDLSDHGAQPMHYSDRYTITYNGEIYNYIELREELKANGYCFSTDCDTEVIMASYDFWGESCLNKFNGMWSFALYDKSANRIFCARDRFGVKPFYYMQLNDKFIFASEIKQFTVFDDWKAVANKNRIHDFLVYGIFDHTNETFFQNVFQLRGGERLIYDLNSCTYNIKKWYELQPKARSSYGNFQDAQNTFFQLFNDSIQLRLRSDVKVGSCLSGGLDSSSIVCMVNDFLKKKGEVNQETVSSCSVFKEYDEQEYIDEVVKKTGINAHKVFPNFEELFEELDLISWHQDEPFVSTSIFAQWNVFKCAKKNNITVMLDGQGADEQLAGYHTYYPIYFIELIKKLRFVNFCREFKLFKAIQGNKSINPFGYMAYYMTFDILPSVIRDKIKAKLTKKDINWLKIASDDNKIEAILSNENKSILKKSKGQLLYSCLPALLHYEDRDSMAHSIESRVPFLDYRLVEFDIGLPSKYKIKNGITKSILRQAMRNVLPEKILKRTDKMGFVSPEEIWIRENSEIFRKEIEEACNRLADFINKEEVLTWFDRTLNSKRAFEYAFWKLISLGRWVKVFHVKI